MKTWAEVLENSLNYGMEFSMGLRNMCKASASNILLEKLHKQKGVEITLLYKIKW